LFSTARFYSYLSPSFHCHGSFGFWSGYLSTGNVVVSDGFYKKTHFVVEAAKTLSWTLMWDPCYKKMAPGMLTAYCISKKREFGIS
jgi:hypothetical protein